MSIEETAEMLTGMRATIVTLKGEESEGMIRGLTPAALYYQPHGMDILESIPVDSLSRVLTPVGRSRHMAAAFLGFAGGAMTGCILADATAQEHTEGGRGWGISRRNVRAIVIMTACGVGGCIGGGAAALAHPDVYRFVSQEPADSTVHPQK